MMSRLLALLLCCTLFTSASIAVAAGDSGDVPTVVLPVSQADGQFDADFDDDFADDFSDDKEVRRVLIADPLEGLNRGTFWVNDKLYFYLFKPIAKGYRFIVPRPVRVSVDNFFSNLTTPVRATNALLQTNFYDCGTEIYRLIVNTTIGIGGLFDPAASVAGVKRKSEDFGQTLGYYGVGHGFYLVLPIIGPSSFRDGGSILVDTFFDPLRYLTLGTAEYLAIHAGKMTNRLSLDRDTYEGIIRDSIDPYLFIRAAYAQRRLAQVGKTPYNLETFNSAMDVLNSTLLDSDTYNPYKWEWLGK